MGARSTSFVLSAAAFTFACSSASFEDADESGSAVTTPAKIKPKWNGPTPGSQNNDIDAAAVLAAWRKNKATFYDQHGLEGYDAQGNVVPLQNYPDGASEATRCMRNTVPSWSDLVMHFYCWQPSYRAATHNVRGCFSYVAPNLQGPPPQDGGVVQPGFEQRLIFYPEIYDFCLFQEYDYAKSQATRTPVPVFDTAVIDANKAAGNRVGVMKWVDDNIAHAWKHVMFTWYDPGAYNMEQQQAVVNAFYEIDLHGKTAYTAQDTAQVTECNAKRPLQDLDPRDGTHCSTSKVTQFKPHTYYAAALQYMTNHVDTLPYSKSLPQ